MEMQFIWLGGKQQQRAPIHARLRAQKKTYTHKTTNPTTTHSPTNKAPLANSLSVHVTHSICLGFCGYTNKAR